MRYLKRTDDNIARKRNIWRETPLFPPFCKMGALPFLFLCVQREGNSSRELCEGRSVLGEQKEEGERGGKGKGG